MNHLLLLLFGAWLGTAPLAPAREQATAGPPAATSPIALLVDGEPISLSEYESWLMRVHGDDEGPAFGVHMELEREAARLGLPLDDLVLRLRLDKEIEARVQGAHGGSRARWQEELAAEGLSEAGFRARRGLELRGEMLCESIARATRVITKELAQRELERRYGEELRFLRVQVLRVDAKFPPPRPGESGEELVAARQVIVQQARARMNLYRTQILNGEPFAEIARANSDDAATREQGGVMKDALILSEWPKNVLLAIQFMGAGELSPVMRIDNSFYLMKILESRSVSVESEKQALIEHLSSAAPDAEEISAVRARLAGNLQVELLPALFESDSAATPRDPAETVLRFQGREHARRTLGAWLRVRIGELRARDFAGQRALLRGAAAAGLSADGPAIEQRVEQEMARVLAVDFGGDPQRLAAAIRQRWRDEAHWKRDLLEDFRVRLPAERLLMARRRVEESAVRALHEERYGPGGRGMVVRWIRIAPAPLETVPESLPSTSAELLEQRRKATEDRARALVERLRAGADFATLAAELSQDPATRVQGGLVQGHVVPERFHPAKRSALASLSVGGFTDPLPEGDSFAIYKYEAAGVVAYEAVADELRRELSESPPDAGEVATELRHLATAAVVVSGPDLLR
jgi:parvulin-like peptidyl-prolyl isomerase